MNTPIKNPSIQGSDLLLMSTSTMILPVWHCATVERSPNSYFIPLEHRVLLTLASSAHQGRGLVVVGETGTRSHWPPPPPSQESVSLS